MAGRHDKEKGVNVQVLLRCRPFNEEELRTNAPQVVTCNDWQREVTVCQNIASKQIDRTFTFDKVFGPSAQQKDLYDQAVVPIVNEVLEGFNCTIFAYGQTGTGKTYTMEGEGKKSKSGQSGELPSDAGVIPRAVKQIFDTLESQNAEYSVKVTFLELYNEEITDLLAPEEISKVVIDEKQRKPLALMEDGKGGVLVRGLEEEIVTSANEIFTLLERGSAKRRTWHLGLQYAMADRIEQMECTLELNHKQLEDLQERYDAKQQLCTELSSKLDSTQKTLEQTRKSLSALKEDYKQSQFAVKEREYIISNQRKAERKEKVSAGNRVLVDNFQTELAEQIGLLCNTVVASMVQQQHHLQSVEQQFQSSLDFQDKSVEDLKKKVVDLKVLYFSHLQALQNITRLHKANSNASLEEMKTAASTNVSSLEEMLGAAADKADSVLRDLQTSLAGQQGEIAAFAQQIRERARTSIEFVKSISRATMGFFENLGVEASKLRLHIDQSHGAREQSIIDFQKAYEAQSRHEEQQLISDISNLVAKAMVRKAEIVNTRLSSMREEAIKDRDSIQEGMSSIEGATSDAKRKWETFAKQAEDDANDTAALSAAKHCRMEVLLQHWDSTEANEQHDAEIGQAKISAEADVEKHNDGILLKIDSFLQHEHKTASDILSTVASHSHTIEKLESDHLSRVTEIEEKTERCFRDEYMEDQSTSTTPTQRTIEIPSRVVIENMRAPPFETLVQEFRENNAYDVDAKTHHENGILKDLKPIALQDSLITRDSRSPLTQVN